MSIWKQYTLVDFTIRTPDPCAVGEKKDKKMYMGLSTTDPLTGILNRRAFQIAVEEELRKTVGIHLY